jgi:Kef-type K+ transport system membrane component KefB
MSTLALATVLSVVVLLASMVSVEMGLSVAILELLGGVVAGNAFGLEAQPWLNFIASFASVVLTFLAGAEVDVDQLRREWKPSLALGLTSFGGPFVATMAPPIGSSTGAARPARLPASPSPRPRWPWSTRCWWRPVSTARGWGSSSCRPPS